MDISVICPIYNGEKYIKALNSSLEMQKEVDMEVIYILTESNDRSAEILNELNVNYIAVKKEDFSHSLCREKASYNCNGDIIVFITQDVIIKDDYFIRKLIGDIKEEKVAAAFARQICENSSIERYTRLNNYPLQSRVVSKEDISELGIKTYFFSDAASAIRKDIFIKLNGYDEKKLLTNEDMYFAYKVINNGYRIKYCSDAVVIHSHDYSYKELFKRYFDQGVFLKQHSYIEEAGSSESALKLFKFVLTNSLKEKNIKVILNLIPNFGVRFIANKLGHRYDKLSKRKILKYTSNPKYWEKEVFTK
ncbi:MAG: glycosyltransferase [Clostridium sp.]|uniref:glycosyltransferase family 2 protein n=1 Tax=Clostridium sp. TaxID=1506 RepID=UPI00290B529A|nr:glycosyltransferase [Clostridium sp.]MDU4937985.1 glycosyltransferase [Clostridium sp.]